MKRMRISRRSRRRMPGISREKAERDKKQPAPRQLTAQRQRRTGTSGRGATLFPILRVSRSSDPAEQEADRLADTVLRMTGPAEEDAVSTSLQRVAKENDPAIQRQARPEENREEQEIYRQEPAEEREADQLQRAVAEESSEEKEIYRLQEEENSEEQEIYRQRPGKGGNDRNGRDKKTAPQVPPRFESRLTQIRGQGAPLPAKEREKFEPRYHADFSGVRVHTGGRARELAAAINARAFTVGNDIVFAPGQYSPGSADGDRLLAHELAHVVQQRRQGRTLQRLGGNTPAPAVPQAERRKLKYRQAQKLNEQYAKDDNLGWGAKLANAGKDAYRRWAALWQAGEYRQFADAVADFQQQQGFPEKAIDGVLGPKTWGLIAGLGEVMAGIKQVHGKAETVCTLASHYRLKRAHQIMGAAWELEEGKNWSTYHVILQSIPSRMKDLDLSYRGSGAAGALVYAGLGSFVAESEIWSGKLQPGAAIQTWGSKRAYQLLQEGTIGKNKRRLREDDANFYGTSFIFVRYDPANKNRLRVRHYGKTQWWSKSDFAVWIAANVNP